MIAHGAFPVIRAVFDAGGDLNVENGEVVLILPEATARSREIIEVVGRRRCEIFNALKPPQRGRGPRSAAEWRAFFDSRVEALRRIGLGLTEARQLTFDNCVISWLDGRPFPSGYDVCAWCDTVERSGAAIVPFGGAPGTWLHAKCWGPWCDTRRLIATRALRRIGVQPSECVAPCQEAA